MCGILGTLFWPGRVLPERFGENFSRALNEVSYRGPDGAGISLHTTARDRVKWLPSSSGPSESKQAAELLLAQADSAPLAMLGHRRLSILDLSTLGSQPLGISRAGGTDPDLWIVYNGEVYNYLEVRAELEALGISFKSGSDTEVILRAFEAWGEACFSRFNGMWAMAIWDSRQKRLILSRDRMGVKPLYWTLWSGGLSFASEIKQLLLLRKLADGSRAHWNSYRLHRFLSQSALHDSEETLFDGIYQFRPAHFAVLEPRGWSDFDQVRAHAKPFWAFPSEKEAFTERRLGFEEAGQELRSLLESAVSLRLRSDVPVGSALSGGLDSSGIVAMLARLNPHRQKTFSATFQGFKLDERRYAEKVIRGTEIEGVFIEPRAQDLMANLSSFIRHHDGPVASTSPYAQWEVFRAAKENGVTVMLDGQGADEIFAGYEGFWRSYLSSVRKNAGFATALKEGVSFYRNHPGYFNLNRLLNRSRRGFNWLECFTPGRRQEIFDRGAEFERSGDPWKLGEPSRQYQDPLREALYRATVCESLPALLTYEDRNSMASSVESRTPFLDYRLVEFAFRLPTRYLVRSGMRKAVLREALCGVVPEEIRTRKDKIGFSTPEGAWMSTMMSTIKNAGLDSGLGDVGAGIMDLPVLRRALGTPGAWRVVSTLFGMKIFE